MFVYASLYGLKKNSKKAPILIVENKILRGAFENLSIPQMEFSKLLFSRPFVKVLEKRYAAYEPIEIDFSSCDGKDISIDGYRQSFRYFDHVRDEIKREFTFEKSIRDRSRRLIDEHLAKNGLNDGKCVKIGVHLRRGDMATQGAFQAGYVPADLGYFKKAVRFYENRLFGEENSSDKDLNHDEGSIDQYGQASDKDEEPSDQNEHTSDKKMEMKSFGDKDQVVSDQDVLADQVQKINEQNKNCLVFLIFGDDHKWNEKESKKMALLFPDQTHLIVVGQEEASALVDLYALILCDHVIISTGTFGWWAAFLSNGLVTYQKDYAVKSSGIDKGVEPKDYFLSGWIPL